jgi:hypothetical protein
VDVVPLPAPPTQIPPLVHRSSATLWLWIIGALAVIAAVGAFVLRRRSDPEPEHPPQMERPGAGFDLPATSTSTDTGEPPATGLPMKLTIVIGKQAGSAHELRLTKTAIIGRGSDCDVVVPDPDVSNHHCELALIHGQLLVYDLNSTNATFVNGVPIRGRHRLEPFDTILVGDTELRVHFEES